MKNVLTFFRRYKKHFPAAALLAGLIWDSITLGRPDRLFDNAVLLFYLIVAGVCIALMSRREHRGEERSFWYLVVAQFAFGNLASGLLVLYNISGTISGNWVFLLLLAGFLIGNELIRGRYERLRFNTTIYYLFIFAYLVISIPVLLRTIAPWVFVFSGLASLAVIAAFLFILRRMAHGVFEANRRQLLIGIASVFILFNIFYYFNVIPPVPLAAREVGIVHHVERLSVQAGLPEGGEAIYELTYEPAPWYRLWSEFSGTLHLGTPGQAYCFSAIFAPARLEAPIYHRWEQYSETAGEWQDSGRIEFPIVGGRDDGFRGYTVKTVAPGKWRCSVETERGSLLGRAEAVVVAGDPEELVTAKR